MSSGRFNTGNANPVPLCADSLFGRSSPDRRDFYSKNSNMTLNTETPTPVVRVLSLPAHYIRYLLSHVRVPFAVNRGFVEDRCPSKP